MTKEDELVRKLRAERGKVKNWQETQIDRRPSRSEVISIRLPSHEFHSLMRASKRVREPMSMFVRTSIALRIALMYGITPQYAGVVASVELPPSPFSKSVGIPIGPPNVSFAN